MDVCSIFHRLLTIFWRGFRGEGQGRGPNTPMKKQVAIGTGTVVLSVISYINCIVACRLIVRCLSHGMCLYQVMMTLRFMNNVANDADTKIENYVIIASLQSARLQERILNRSASLVMSTSVLEALPGKLDIKSHSPSIFYIAVTALLSNTKR